MPPMPVASVAPSASMPGITSLSQAQEPSPVTLEKPGPQSALTHRACVTLLSRSGTYSFPLLCVIAALLWEAGCHRETLGIAGGE